MAPKYITYYLLAFVCVISVGLFTFGGVSPVQNTVTLPINVYAPNGFSATNGSQPEPFGDETVTINVADAGAVESLGFWMHQPYYHLGGGSNYDEQEGFDNEGAVAISINGGPFVDITDANTTCAFPEGQMGPYNNDPGSDNQGKTANNCIGGPTPSPRFSVSPSFSGGLQTGDNTVTFRYNGTKGSRSGYRVMYIAALGGGTTLENVDWLSGGLLANGTTSFKMDDPESWGAPSGGDAANGERLFTSRNILKGHVNQTNPSMPGDDIVAACSDCHAKDGSDLWYFNYSNESIIARSAFHGLTQEQGKDIAAYIRSIRMTNNEGNSYPPPGRPWNPPFQPGPTYGLDGSGVNAWDGLTDSESHFWAAGAGLDDYLSDPLEEGKYLFPEGGDPGHGTPPTGIETFTDPTTGKQELPWKKFATGSRDDIDLKKYPLAVQFPDWNTWLPDISPVGDISGGDIRTYNNYYDKYEWLAGDGNSADFSGGNAGSLNPNDPGDVFRVLKRFSAMYRAISDFRNSVTGKGADSAIDAKEDLSTLQYNMVKVWEIYQHYDLYDHADQPNSHPQIDRPVSEYNDWSLDIGFKVGGRHFFDAGPHILGDNRIDSDHWHFGSFVGQKWATHVWYQLQVTLDPGSLAPSIPVDWQYQDGHMGEFAEHTNLDASYRQFASQMRRFQQSYDSGIGVCPSCKGHSKLEQVAVWAKQGQPSHAMYAFAPDQSGKWNRVFISISDAAKRRLTGAWLRAWWDSYKRPPISDFQQRRCTDDKKWCWEPGSEVPEVDAWVDVENIKLDRFYNGLKYAAEAGVAPGVIDSIATKWASPMWPEANNSNYQSHGLPYSWEGIAPKVSVSQHTVSLDAGWNYVSSYVEPSDPSMTNVFSNTSDLGIVKDESGRVYIPDRSVNQVSPWSSSEGYLVHAKNAHDVTLIGSRIATDTPIELHKGWNVVPFYSSSSMDASTAFGSIESVVEVVRDEAGNEYVPSEGKNEIGDLVPGEGYVVYVSQDASLVYPTN